MGQSQQSIDNDKSVMIDEVEIYFEPHEFVKQFITGGSTDSFFKRKQHDSKSN